MGRVISITSGKGGVGKSSVTINLGIALAACRYKVCLIDADYGLKNLDVMMGLENRVIFDMKDIFEGYVDINDALIRDKNYQNLYLLPACKSVNIDTYPKGTLKLIVNKLRNDFDFVLIDTPAGIERGFKDSIECIDEAVIVTNLDVTALQDADRVIGILQKNRVNNISMIINKVNKSYIKKGISMKIEEASRWLSVPLLGIVYDDEMMIKSNNRGIPLTVLSNNFASLSFSAIADRINNKEVEIPIPREKTILERIFLK